MKRIKCIMFSVILLFSCLNVFASDAEPLVGEVLYHQNFSEISDIVNSGIRLGTLSTEKVSMNCLGDSLNVQMYDNGRAYMLIPKIQKPDTYTVEFSFSFDTYKNDNGYIAFILTCRGVEPTNISSVSIRANGVVDDFDGADELLMESISSGELVNVRIPIENNVLHQIFLSVGENEYVLNRDKVLIISNEDMGFAIRNAGVKISEVFVVSGVDYEKKFGYYSENSYATDEKPVIPTDDGYLSPETSDYIVTVYCMCGLSVVALVIFLIIGKRRR